MTQPFASLLEIDSILESSHILTITIPIFKSIKPITYFSTQHKKITVFWKKSIKVLL